MPPSTDPLPAGRTRSTSTQIPATSPSSTPHRADSDVHGAQQALRTPPKSKPLASSPQTLARTKPSRARASVKSPLLQPFGYEKAAAADTDVVSASSDSEAERAPRARRSLEPSRKRSKTGQTTFLSMDVIELGPRRCDVIADGEESYFTGSLKCDCGSELQASSTILCEQCLVSFCPRCRRTHPLSALTHVLLVHFQACVCPRCARAKCSRHPTVAFISVCSTIQSISESKLSEIDTNHAAVAASIRRAAAACKNQPNQTDSVRDASRAAPYSHLTRPRPSRRYLNAPRTL
jgi:hypothetical protein